MHQSTIWGVLPIKRTDHAKSRLSAVLSQKQRQALMLAMLQDVLDAMTRARGLAGVALVTDDKQVIKIGQHYDCRVITEGVAEGHTAAVTTAGRILAAEGQAGLLTIPGDVPLVTAAEIEAVLDAHLPAPAFTIVPAHDEQGSNGVLLTPPEVVTLRFGENSFFPHLAAARAAGLVPRIVHLAGLACDIDTPEDIDRFLSHQCHTRTRALLTDEMRLRR